MEQADVEDLSPTMKLVSEVLKRRKLQSEVKKLSDYIDSDDDLTIKPPLDAPKPEEQQEQPEEQIPQAPKRKVKKEKTIDIDKLGDEADEIMHNVQKTTDKKLKRVLKQKLTRRLNNLVKHGAMGETDVEAILKQV